MKSSTITPESLVEQVRRGGVEGHTAFDYLAEIASGQQSVRPLLSALESEIASGAITLEPYPEVMSRSLLQSFFDLFPKAGSLPPDIF